MTFPYKRPSGHSMGATRVPAQLTAHFALKEFTKSATADKHGIDNLPKEAHEVANLAALADKVLERVRKRFDKPLIITSGYRSRALNQKIGGARESQHLFGEAADFIIPDASMRDVAIVMAAMDDIPFDQLIYERRDGSEWIHVSHRRLGGNRREVLSIIQERGVRKIYNGVVTIEEVS